MAMLTSYSIWDSVLVGAGSGGGAIAGKGLAKTLDLTGFGEAGAVAGLATLGTYAALKLRPPPSPDAKPMIPQEGEEMVGIIASIGTAIFTYTAITALAPAGPFVQYLGSGAAVMTYGPFYEGGKMVYSFVKGVSDYASSIIYTLFPFLKPAKSEGKKKEDKKEKEEEEEEEDKEKKKKKKPIGKPVYDRPWSSFVYSQISVPVAAA